MACLSAQIASIEGGAVAEFPSSSLGCALQGVRKARALGGAAEQAFQKPAQAFDVVSRGLSQAELDALSVDEAGVHDDVEEEAFLLRARRMRGLWGADLASASGAEITVKRKDSDHDVLTSVGSTRTWGRSVCTQSSQDGLSQAALDALSSTEGLISQTEVDALSYAHGLSQSVLDSLSVQCQAVDEDADSELFSPGPDQELLRIRRVRAFQGNAAATALIADGRVKHDVEALLSPSAGGKTQQQLDKLCVLSPCSPNNGVEQVATPTRKRRSLPRQSSPEQAVA